MRTPKQRLHPEIAAVVGDLDLQVNAGTLAALRSAPPVAVPLSDAVEREDVLVPGDPPVPVRVHRPRGVEGALPCMVSIHGGGHVVGSYDMDDAMLDALCPSVGMIGVSVEYRLSPEHPYPAALDDCYAALRWTYEHAAELGIDADRIGVRGISAGGCLAAGVALAARDRGDVPLAFQLLDCPMLDDRQASTSIQVDGLPVWTRESNEYGWSAYLGALSGTDGVPHTAAPARATDLAGLPPTFVSVGAVDGFLDEDVDYALRLAHAGVDVELHVYAGAGHGYQMAATSQIAAQSRTDIERWLTRRLGA